MIKERKTTRLHGYDYSSDNLYFVTSCVHSRICCFGEIVGTGRDPSLQPSIIKIKPLSELIGAYKTTVSKQIHQAGFIEFKWQRSFYEHIIHDEKSFETISDYIFNNPENWEQDNLFNL